eukprot:1480845-Amphidinium_carterae.1
MARWSENLDVAHCGTVFGSDAMLKLTFLVSCHLLEAKLSPVQPGGDLHQRLARVIMSWQSST